MIKAPKIQLENQLVCLLVETTTRFTSDCVASDTLCAEYYHHYYRHSAGAVL